MSITRWKLGWKRCDCVKCEAALTIEQTEEDCGWVRWGDHKEEIATLKAEVDALKLGSLLTAVDVLAFINLKAEVERLRASSFVTAVPVEEYEKLKAEVERLEGLVKYWQIEAETDHAHWVRHAETNERLRKAGDAMADAMERNGCDPLGCHEENKDAVKAWLAAKEGKQP